MAVWFAITFSLFECSQMLVDTVAHFREQLDGKPLPASGWDAGKKMPHAGS
uniref:Putative ATP/GTP-binding protein n=1 Tax=Klebsiella pneumoniae TaxID=573 RepID=A0A8B0T058_KLEPN|nr:putative ATP/GTP-binding protein [Klebsiella pneumoniae]